MVTKETTSLAATEKINEVPMKKESCPLNLFVAPVRVGYINNNKR